ncbi:MAG: ACT domain-containing protein [Actinobacteria bacterium]|nr:ACT domain-containing protein [Actinomycetota bacterium]
MELQVHPTALAVCRLDASAPVPAWVTDTADPMISVTRTPDELSIVVPEAAVPGSVRAESGWRALSVKGPLDLSMTGVLASLSVPLADAGIPIFVVSTYDTDWLLVKEDDLDGAIETLLDADLEVTGL